MRTTDDARLTDVMERLSLAVTAMNRDATPKRMHPRWNNPAYWQTIAQRVEDEHQWSLRGQERRRNLHEAA